MANQAPIPLLLKRWITCLACVQACSSPYMYGKVYTTWIKPRLTSCVWSLSVQREARRSYHSEPFERQTILDEIEDIKDKAPGFTGTISTGVAHQRTCIAEVVPDPKAEINRRPS